jgi:hypothetical protein
MATAKLTSADIVEVAFQDNVDSYPIRTNFANLKNAINGVVDDIAAASIGTTNAETTAARPYHTALLTRLDSIRKGQFPYVKSGGVVSASTPAAMTVDVSAGEASVDGVDVKWSTATSGTITAPVSNTRYDVVVVNSDSTLSVVTGVASANPILPDIATSQKPLAIITLASTTATITASELYDCRQQGCVYMDDGAYKWSWKIQTAIDDVTAGDIYIGRGK